jgi:hypothetical protein
MNKIQETVSRIKARRKMLTIYPNLKTNEHVHHIDHNPFNNDINNLIIVDASDHISYHKIKFYRDNPDYKPVGNPKPIQDRINQLELLILDFNERNWNY